MENGVFYMMREMFDIFQNPPAEYRMIPLWLWTGKIRRDEVARQIAEMKQKGIGGFFISPFSPLDPNYLSSEWFSLVRFTIREANNLGLSIWIYDDIDWPSGRAAGKVTAVPNAECVLLK